MLPSDLEPCVDFIESELFGNMKKLNASGLYDPDIAITTALALTMKRYLMMGEPKPDKPPEDWPIVVSAMQYLIPAYRTLQREKAKAQAAKDN